MLKYYNIIIFHGAVKKIFRKNFNAIINYK